ncbi:hypothetical protein, partial [Frankia sp. KB5]|uniref:hypothetical protein n=1 Tax=Frankia sp. KB5 TaxID=683318 RepID=UPI000A255761
MRDDLLARVQGRLELFAAESSPEIVLANDAVLEVMGLRSELLDRGGAGSGHAGRRWEPGFQR